MEFKTLEHKYREAFEKINKANFILLIAHIKPDGDSLSTVCAMMDYLINIGKNFHAFAEEPNSKYYFLPHIDRFVYSKNKLTFNQYDLIITFDCGSLDRTGLADEIKNRQSEQQLIEFDHHTKMEDIEGLEIRIPTASSTAEVLYYFFKFNKIKFTKNIANTLLTGILTDTHNFLFPTSTHNTIKISSEMLSYGARFPVINENAWRNKTIPGMRLWGKALNNLRINHRYNIAYSVLTHKDVKDNDATPEELDGIPAFLSNLDDVKALLFLIESREGSIKGSLRTKYAEWDLAKLANALGGGGHKRASGFTIEGHIEENNGGWKIV
jgi:bifunctional oligoribonuclease and PAP phosphatase NrnA